MAITAVSYIIIQVPAFIYINEDGTDENGSLASDERDWAIAGFIVCTLLFFAYLALEVYSNLGPASDTAEDRTLEVTQKALKTHDVSIVTATLSVIHATHGTPGGSTGTSGLRTSIMGDSKLKRNLRTVSHAQSIASLARDNHCSPRVP